MSLALLTLLLGTSPTQAQYNGGYPGSGPAQDPGHYWQITYTNTDGKTTWAIPDSPAQGQSAAQEYDWTPQANGDGLESETYINTKSTGTVTATLTWVPAAGQTLQSDPPSEPVYIKEFSTAEESPANWNGSGTAPTPAGSADDGLGDPPVAWNQGYISMGTHLIHKDGSSGIITLDPITVTASNPTSTWQTGGYPGGGYPGGGYPGGGGSWNWIGGLVEVSFSVSITTDDRAVTISADFDGPNDSTPTFYKNLTGGVDANGDPLCERKPHKRDPDGTMKGDRGLDYGDGDYQNPYNHVNVTYTANLIGDWAENLSQYLWNTSLKNASYPGTLYGVPPDPGIQTLTNVYSKPFFPNPTQSPSIVFVADAGSASGVPQVDHLYFKYQNGDNRPDPWTPYATGNDGDGVIATANYYLSLHQPVEFLPSQLATEYITKEIPDEDVEVASPGYASPGLAADCKLNAPGAYWDYLGGGVGAMAEIPGVDEVPWLGLFCAAAGIAIDHLKPVPDTGSATFDPVQPGSTFPDEQTHPFATTDHNFFEMTPHFLGIYQRAHLLQDTYDKTGFVSEKLIDSDAYQRVGGSFGDYKYHPGK